ncbi:hypothetical protein LTR53_004925 [Teratosphaeriaceae sp. CCFEE 6253]|nr:hypothetical protein LTR53_004925 [Teratosphaeriaceae sp. CCFEE 6253]
MQLPANGADLIVPPPPGWEIIGGGCTARVERRFDSDEVVKLKYSDCPNPDCSRRELEREYAIYQRLPPHPRLLTLLPGSTPQRLVLPYLPNGTLSARLTDPDAAPLTIAQRLQLATDAAEGVAVLHAHGVMHSDLQPSNFRFDGEHRLRVIDFAGLQLDGEQGTAMESTRYFLPRSYDEPSTPRTDLFALGSVLYAIFSGRAPYANQEDDEVTRLFSEGDFPTTGVWVGGEVITRCWTGDYAAASEAHRALADLLAEHDESQACCPPVSPAKLSDCTINVSLQVSSRSLGTYVTSKD